MQHDAATPQRCPHVARPCLDLRGEFFVLFNQVQPVSEQDPLDTNSSDINKLTAKFIQVGPSIGRVVGCQFATGAVAVVVVVVVFAVFGAVIVVVVVVVVVVAVFIVVVMVLILAVAMAVGVVVVLGVVVIVVVVVVNCSSCR